MKSIGGLDYRYALRGDGQPAPKIVDAAEQRRAVNAVLRTISPEALTLPERILRRIPPRPAGLPETRELFGGRTGVTFDPVGAAESAADTVVALLTNPQRATRLVEYHARDLKTPSLDEVLDRLFGVTWKAAPVTGLAAEVQSAVQLVALRRVMSLAADEAASGAARAIAMAKVVQLKRFLATSPTGAFAVSQINAYEKDPKELRLPKPADSPPGMPIGTGEPECGWRE